MSVASCNTALEVPAVEQSGQRIVRGLIGHLPRQAAHFGHIVQQHHHADALAGFHADRRRRQLDQALAVDRANQQRAAADVERRADRERLPHRLGQQLAIRILDHARDLLERLAGGGGGIHAEQARSGQIQMLDLPSVSIVISASGSDSSARRARERRSGSCNACTLCVGSTSTPTTSKRLLAFVLDRPGRELQARAIALHAAEIDLVALGGSLAGQAPAHVVADQFGIFRGTRSSSRRPMSSSTRQPMRLANWGLA
jgi:hypothetical protein